LIERRNNMEWLKRNWLWILIIIATWGVISGVISVNALIKDNRQYKADIESLNNNIKREEQKVEAKEDKIAELRASREHDKTLAGERVRKMEENQKRELAKISAERDEWMAKVKVMPPSELVLEIKVILKTDEIWGRPDGVLFSLTAAKDCLAILGDFSIAEDERDQWKADYFKAMDVIKDKDGIIAGDELIFTCFDAIIFTKDKIIGKERERFRLSERRNVASYWRGIKQGAPVGGGIVLLLWLVFGK